MKLSIIALAIALSLAFATKPPSDLVLLGCSGSCMQRDNQLAQALTSIIAGPYEMIGYTTFEKNGTYCYKIYLVGELEPTNP